MAEAGLPEIFKVVYESLHMSAGGNQNPPLDEVIAVVNGELEDAPGIRADQAGKVIVCNLGPCHSRGMEPYWKESVTHEKGLGHEGAGIPYGYAAFLNCLLDKAVQRVFQKLIEYIHLPLSPA